MFDGVLNIYKEQGYTSHDVVAKMRGILKQKKIGHTGTLDPDAEGVLPVCLGQATRLCDMLTDKTKTYRAVLLLGVETDTQDAGGRILKECPVEAEEEAVRRAIESFIGDYEQIPPMYSAIKVDGKKLYELARQGKVIERKSRPVTIYDIQVEKVELPRITMTVHCSKGTYIRTLCHDIGQKLGCGGCMEHLLRTQVERFLVEDSLTLTQLEKLRDEGLLESRLVSVEEMFSQYEKLMLLSEADKLGLNGNPVPAELLEGRDLSGKTEVREISVCRLYTSDGTFLGIYQYEKEGDRFRPQKMFLRR